MTPVNKKNEKPKSTSRSRKNARVPHEANVTHHTLPHHDQISKRAYELWQKRGFIHGYDRDDWFKAETQLNNKLRK